MPVGSRRSPGLFCPASVASRAPGSASARRQRFQHGLHCLGLRGRDRAVLWKPPASGEPESRGQQSPGRARGGAHSGLVQQRAEITELHRSGPHRRRADDCRSLAHVADGCQRMGDGHDGATSLDSAQGVGARSGEDGRLFRAGSRRYAAGPGGRRADLQGPAQGQPSRPRRHQLHLPGGSFFLGDLAFFSGTVAASRVSDEHDQLVPSRFPSFGFYLCH